MKAHQQQYIEAVDDMCLFACPHCDILEGLPRLAAIPALTMLAVESFDPRLLWDCSIPKDSILKEVRYA